MHPPFRTLHIASLSRANASSTSLHFASTAYARWENRKPTRVLQMNYNYNMPYGARCTGNNFIAVIILISCSKATCYFYLDKSMQLIINAAFFYSHTYLCRYLSLGQYVTLSDDIPYSQQTKYRRNKNVLIYIYIYKYKLFLGFA